MRKINWLEYIFVLLWAGIVTRLLHAPVMTVLDTLSVKVIGKALSGRTPAIRFAVLFMLAAAAAFLVRMILSLRKTEMLHVVCMILILALLFVICALQTLRRDDYWEIRDAEKYGFWEYIRYEYVTFNGRFFSLFLKALYIFIPQTLCINALLILTIILLSTGTSLLFKTVSSDLSPISTMTGGICAAAGILFSSPKIWETWFWGSGTLVYGTGIALAVTAAALMLAVEVSAENKNKNTAAAFICLTCACGCSELITASVCAFSLLLLLLPRILYKRVWNIRNGLLTLWTWLLTGFILATSGNFSRAGGLSGSRSAFGSGLLSSLPGKFWESIGLLWRYSSTRIEYLAIFAILFFLTGLCYRSAKIRAGALCAASAGLILTAAAVCTINTVIDFTPARVISIPLAWICTAMMLAAYSLGSYTGKHIFRNTRFHVTEGLIPLILLTVVSHFFLLNIGQVCKIRTAWIERDRTLSAMKGADEQVMTCAIPVMGSVQADPVEDPSDDTNIVTAYYYGFPSITADRLCPPFSEEYQ